MMDVQMGTKWAILAVFGPRMQLLVVPRDCHTPRGTARQPICLPAPSTIPSSLRQGFRPFSQLTECAQHRLIGLSLPGTIHWTRMLAFAVIEWRLRPPRDPGTYSDSVTSRQAFYDRTLSTRNAATLRGLVASSEYTVRLVSSNLMGELISSPLTVTTDDVHPAH